MQGPRELAPKERGGGGERERKGGETWSGKRADEERARRSLGGPDREGGREGGRVGTNNKLTCAAGASAGPSTAKDAPEGIGGRGGGGQVHSLGVRGGGAAVAAWGWREGGKGRERCAVSKGCSALARTP